MWLEPTKIHWLNFIPSVRTMRPWTPQEEKLIKYGFPPAEVNTWRVLPLSADKPYIATFVAEEKHMSFIPKNYELPAVGSAKDFLQMPKDGESIRFVVLEQLVAGWSYWTDDKKCFRSLEPFVTTKGIKEGESPKHFWAFRVLDIETKEVKIVEIAQSTVQKVLYEIATSDEWELLQKCAIKITRTGKGKNDTKYSVMPFMLNDENSAALAACLADKSTWPDLQKLLFSLPEETDGQKGADLKEVM